MYDEYVKAANNMSLPTHDREICAQLAIAEAIRLFAETIERLVQEVQRREET